jgi:hypothetical protein
MQMTSDNWVLKFETSCRPRLELQTSLEYGRTSDVTRQRRGRIGGKQRTNWYVIILQLMSVLYADDKATRDPKAYAERQGKRMTMKKDSKKRKVKSFA